MQCICLQGECGTRGAQPQAHHNVYVRMRTGPGFQLSVSGLYQGQQLELMSFPQAADVDLRRDPTPEEDVPLCSRGTLSVISSSGRRAAADYTGCE